jgi:hypothetical protein
MNRFDQCMFEVWVVWQLTCSRNKEEKLGTNICAAAAGELIGTGLARRAIVAPIAAGLEQEITMSATVICQERPWVINTHLARTRVVTI